MINKKYRLGFIVIIVICIALLAVGAKYDYRITDKLYNPNSVFGIALESFSSLPIYLFIPVFGCCMMLTSRDQIAAFAAGVAVMIAGCSVEIYMIFRNLYERDVLRTTNPYISGVLGGIAAAGLFFLMRKIPRKTIRRIQSMCAFSLVYMVGYLGSHGVLKILCGRDRYEDIITGGEYAFAQWFKPVFFSSGSSFPSGHVGGAMGVMVLLLIPFIFKGCQKLKLPIFIGCYAYVFIVAVSRMIMGKHFISDIAMSILIMTIGFMIVSYLYEMVYRKYIIRQ